MAPSCGAVEGWPGGPDGPLPAAVALGQVAPRAMTLPEATTYFLSPKEERKRVWPSPSVSLQPPPAEDGIERVLDSEQEGVFPLLSAWPIAGKVPLPRAQGSVPTQAQPLPSPQPPALSHTSSPPASGQS